MYFSKPQHPADNSFSLLKGRFNAENLRIPKQDRNQIKINKSKLPSDFFKKSLQRSLPRKSALDSSSNRLSLPKTTVLRKYPQTQRKINSYNQLPQSSQFDYPIDFAMAKTHNLRAQVQQRKSLNRKSLLMDINTNEEDLQQIKMIKDYVKPKCLKRNEASEILEANSQLRNLIKQKFANKFGSEQFIELSTAIPEQIDMGCTFGKGFKLANNQHETSMELSNQKSSRSRNRGKKSSKKKSCEQKSTEQSEVYEGVKSNENSPLRIPDENKISLLPEYESQLDHQKVNKIQWNTSKQDLSLFQGLYPEKSKEVFTAQEKQRKSKYRTNNSSNNYRQKAQRKQKRLGQLNLPKITKTTHSYQDCQA